MRYSSRAQKIIDNLPERYGADAAQVEAWPKGLPGKTWAMEYDPKRNLIHITEFSLNGWHRGLLPLGVIAYKDEGGSGEVAMEIVLSAMPWAKKNRKHLTRIAKSGEFKHNAVGDPIESYCL